VKWSSEIAGTITGSQFLQVRLTSSAAFGTAVGASVTVGALSDTWTVTTVAQDLTPNAFAFVDQGGLSPSTVVTSTVVQITGITGPVSTSIAGGGASYRVCGDAACSANPGFITGASSINNGQYLQLRTTAPGSYGTTANAVITVGTGSDTWSVTTGAQMVTFSFGQQNTGYGYPCSGYTSPYTIAVGSSLSVPLHCPYPYYPAWPRCSDTQGNDTYICSVTGNGDNYTMTCGPIPANVQNCRFWGASVEEPASAAAALPTGGRR
jgi:hypothetical protein